MKLILIQTCVSETQRAFAVHCSMDSKAFPASSRITGAQVPTTNRLHALYNQVSRYRQPGCARRTAAAGARGDRRWVRRGGAAAAAAAEDLNSHELQLGHRAVGRYTCRTCCTRTAPGLGGTVGGIERFSASEVPVSGGLSDQFDNLEKHTSWGIDFLERYTKFVKERADIELSYAKQISITSFKSVADFHGAFQETTQIQHTVNRPSHVAENHPTWQQQPPQCHAAEPVEEVPPQEKQRGREQREELADNLSTQVVCELTRFTQELKTERKTRCSLKARQTAQQKQQAAEESRKDYATSLNQFNQDQHQHYHTLVPVIYQRIQDMEERRIERICDAMRSSAEAERKTLPAFSRCLDAMMDAAESIQPRMDTRQVVEVYKSGFDPPGDVEFEDYSATMRRSISESSYLDNRTEGRRHSRKLWPFIRKNKLLTLLSSPRQPPPPPPTSPSPGDVASSPQSPPPVSREPITQRLNDLMTSGSRTRKQCLRSLKRGGSSPADCSHLPPEQRRKKLQTRINNINQEIQREREQSSSSSTSYPLGGSIVPLYCRLEDRRDALLKMREVYEQSPQMGDAESLEPRLEEVKQSLQRLEDELRRNQAWLMEVDSRLSGHSSRRQSGGCGFNSQATTPGSSSLKQLDNRSPASRESPDGSYTEDQSTELHFKSRSSEFDDDFDDEEPLPSIGTCKSLYPFQGQNEGTLSMVEGELLSVVEEDKGDGWTRVRRNLEEEGYVPTSYIKVFLDSSAKGAMTYI
ncbi:hypothetical protein INR49_023196 [Caranx melampygus]|nr:hypothetical protein INR49_023196 [Caranx melampygus]